MPKKVGAATVPLAGKLDDRTAPYTVPMKAVPQQCGALGRVRPALRLCRGAHGPTSPRVPVRALSRPGHPVQPLRPRQPLLQPGLLAPGPRPGAARSRSALPAVPARPHRPCTALRPLAPAPCGRGWRRRARTECDASGFPACGGNCSTGGMDTRQRIQRSCRRHPRDHRGEHAGIPRSRRVLDLPPLWRPPGPASAPGLRAARSARPAAAS